MTASEKPMLSTSLWIPAGVSIPGDTIPIVDPAAVEITPAELFVAILDASNSRTRRRHYGARNVSRVLCPTGHLARSGRRPVGVGGSGARRLSGARAIAAPATGISCSGPGAAAADRAAAVSRLRQTPPC
jgi:hypothetical protein